MFKLNFKIALRNLLRNKTASLINISGLAIGLSACLMLLLYVAYEWNYDRGYKNEIYHLMVNFSDKNKQVENTGDQVPNVLAKTLKQEIPEIEHIARIVWPSKRLLTNGENAFKVEGRSADAEILKIFDYQFISGSPDKAFDDPNSVILTESAAKRLFGSTDVLNKVLKYENQVDVKVTGVIKDHAANTTYQFDCLVPWTLYEKLDNWVGRPNWGNYAFYTLLTLKNDVNVAQFNQKIANFIDKHEHSDVTDPTVFAYPLVNLHLYGDFEKGHSSGGKIEQVHFFVALALGILIIACINFMNLATARSQKRAKEVGIKKTIGASRKSLIWQFLLESLLLTFVSVILAVILVELALPKFNHLMDVQLELSYGNPIAWLAAIALILLTGILAGSYPAFFLSSFNPIQTMKKSVNGTKGFSLNFRQVLVVIQFSFAVVLIVGTLIVYQQLQYIKNKPLGYNVNSLLEMPHEGNLYPKYDLLKERLLASGAVTSVCQASGSISTPNSNGSGMEWPGMAEDGKRMSFNQIYTGYDFFKTNQVQLLEGRDFDPRIASDHTAVLLSETAIKTMGLKDPVGQVIKLWGGDRAIIGVFKDITWGDPAKRNLPMLIGFNPQNSDVIIMRMNTNNATAENMEVISQITKEINPQFPVDLKFVDGLIAAKFQNEKILGILSNLFGGLAIFISCLGLFGLSAFSAEQRTKEIGLRKVLGASVSGLVKLLSLNFVKMVLVALIIAMPIAYLLMEKWLSKFDYHVAIGWPVFILTAVLTLMVAFLTVSWQAYRAAKTNPVEALKYE
ncbi:ABC transporter permease [Pedobacter gandavensis]|uniref:FtsX-like permease family protein n=1 Tax=Pedobacter gandavensis TaxID=2679963 RepID=A0ABR6EVH6_9SPHI|nr:ABC transporter permease [Pedobacter gandavensis]MBB2149212.1 FtsX-like permease family protein [Pedobacter gandavensis]